MAPPAAVVAMAALAVSVLALNEAQTQYRAMGLTGFDGLNLAAPTEVGTATPALLVNQAGLGKIADFQDGGTSVFEVYDGGTVTIDTDLIVDDTFNIDDTAYSSVGAQTLTPTASFYTLAPATVLTLTLGTTGTVAGDFVWFVSTVSTSTTIVDTTATAGGGNRALGQNDVIGFIYTGSVWAEAFYSDNS